MSSIAILDQVSAADVCLVTPVSKDTQKATSSSIFESFHTSRFLDLPDNHVIKIWILQNRVVGNWDSCLSMSA